MLRLKFGNVMPLVLIITRMQAAESIHSSKGTEQPFQMLRVDTGLEPLSLLRTQVERLIYI
jgi:hypothetical protein